MGNTTVVEVNSEVLEAIAFIGETLAPFYLQDPQKGNAGDEFAAMAALDADAASSEWPFVDDDEVREYLAEMVKGLQAGCSDEKLYWEYRRLFVGPAAKVTPPWGSVYTDRECVIFGESTLALREWMREHSIERSSDEKNPDDHIGFMLALMSWLATNQPEDLESFLQLHLLTWSTHFLNEVISATTHPFYKGLASLTKASLEGIQSELEIDVTYPKFYR